MVSGEEARSCRRCCRGRGGAGVPACRAGRTRFADRLVYGARATPYEVLSEFSERVGDAYGEVDVLPRMARALGEGIGAERSDVWLMVGTSFGGCHVAGAMR